MTIKSEELGFFTIILMMIPARLKILMIILTGS